ncbi:MAG TPA: TIGR04452 family lipoprotein [Leptospiraceae bacterium]|nr:TIGR04452 family lipoprotein [Leptospiraceae bacterium]
MKLIIKLSLISIVTIFLHCPITNKLFIKPSKVKGGEAKEIIKNRLASFFVNDISTNSNNSLAADFIIPSLAGIQDDKIYSRRDVENCATKIFLAAIAIDLPNITANRNKKSSDPLRTSDPNSRLIPPILCQLNAIDKIIDID